MIVISFTDKILGCPDDQKNVNTQQEIVSLFLFVPTPLGGQLIITSNINNTSP